MWDCESCGCKAIAASLSDCPHCSTATEVVAASDSDAGHADEAARTASYADIRAWAAGEGIEVSPKGKLPQAVLDAYDDAHRPESRP